MNSKTASLVVRTPRDRVFAYLSNIENLPKWATEFCRELKVIRDGHKVVTPMGEMFFEIQADQKTGVIDMLAGVNESQMRIFPLRVIELPGDSSAILFTMFQAPGTSDEQFEGQYKSLQRELENIKREFAKR